MGQYVSRFRGSSTTAIENGDSSVIEEASTKKIDKEDIDVTPEVNGSHRESKKGSGEEEVTSSGESDSLLVHPGNESTRLDLTLDSTNTHSDPVEDQEEEETEDEEDPAEANGHNNTNGSNGHHAEANGSSSQSQTTWASVVAGVASACSPGLSVGDSDQDSRSESSSILESTGDTGRSGGRKRRKSPRGSPNKRAKDTADDRPFACSVPDCEWAFKALFHLNRHRKNVHGILEPVTAATYILQQQASIPASSGFDEVQEANVLFDNILESGSY